MQALPEIVLLLGLYHCVRLGQAQQLSSLTSSSLLQATGSSAFVTVVGSSPKNITVPWGFLWNIQNTPVALIVINQNLTITTSVTDSKYNERISFKNSHDFTSDNTFKVKSHMTLSKLKKEENNLEVTVQLVKVNSRSLHVILNVTDCSAQTESSVEVLSENPYFNHTGYFSCLNNGTLFNISGVPLISNVTKCQTAATWFGEDTVQCWNAPRDVKINGLTTVVEGKSLDITCDYSDVNPVGSSSRLYVDNSVKIIHKGQMYTLRSINASLDNKQITCQAVTPYTRIFNDTGKSPVYKLNVQYVPHQHALTTCTWKVNQTEWCNVTFRSNPRANFLKLLRNGSAVRRDKSTALFIGEEEQSNRTQTFYFKRLKASINDYGNYCLIIHSSLPPFNHTIKFNIILLTSTVVNHAGLTAGIIAAVVGFILVLASTAYFYVRKKRHRSDAGPGTSSRNTYSELRNEVDVPLRGV